VLSFLLVATSLACSRDAGSGASTQAAAQGDPWTGTADSIVISNPRVAVLGPHKLHASVHYQFKGEPLPEMWYRCTVQSEGNATAVGDWLQGKALGSAGEFEWDLARHPSKPMMPGDAYTVKAMASPTKNGMRDASNEVKGRVVLGESSEVRPE
jgi:hypothetical protein